jgi:hypothetical protein
MIGEQCIVTNLEGSGHDVVQEPSRNFPGKCRKANEVPSQESRCLGRVSKQKPPYYKFRALSLGKPVRLLRSENFSLQEFRLNAAQTVYVTYNSCVSTYPRKPKPPSYARKVKLPLLQAV